MPQSFDLLLDLSNRKTFKEIQHILTSKLIPRTVSVLGLIGYAALSIGAGLELFGFEVGLMLAIPGGILELILPVWLIVKGFNSPTITPGPAKTVLNARDELGLARAYTVLGSVAK